MLASLSIFWADLDLPSLRDIASCLSSNTSLTSLSLGDPVTMSDHEAAEASRRIMQHAGATLRRLSLAYVPFPSLAAAQSFCAALEGNSGQLLPPLR